MKNNYENIYVIMLSKIRIIVILEKRGQRFKIMVVSVNCWIMVIFQFFPVFLKVIKVLINAVLKLRRSGT